MRTLSVALVYGCVVPVLKTIPPFVLTEFDRVKALFNCSMAACAFPPSCLNTILGLSFSSLSSVSASIVS